MIGVGSNPTSAPNFIRELKMNILQATIDTLKDVTLDRKCDFETWWMFMGRYGLGITNYKEFIKLLSDNVQVEILSESKNEATIVIHRSNWTNNIEMEWDNSGCVRVYGLNC